MTNLEIIRELEGLREHSISLSIMFRRECKIHRKYKMAYAEGKARGIKIANLNSAKELKQLIRKIKNQTV